MRSERFYDTGHTEVVQITFDPHVLSYRVLFQIFFTVHDPAAPNRQGPDVGPQSRWVIFYHTPQQKPMAGQVI